MVSAPPASPPSFPPNGATARGAHSISWRSVRVLRAGKIVQAPARVRALRHLQNHAHLPDGYTLDLPPGWAIDFMGFDADKQGE